MDGRLPSAESPGDDRVPAGSPGVRLPLGSMAALALAILLAVAVGMGASATATTPPDAAAYQRDLNFFWISDFIGGLAVLALFLSSGWGGRLGAVLSRRLGGPVRATTAMIVIVLAAQSLAGLPLAWCKGFWHEHVFGLSTETAGHWAADQATALVVQSVIALVLGWIPALLLVRLTRFWWLGLWAALCPVLIATMVVVPVAILPLFHHYAPMADRDLETGLRAEAARVGLGDAPILVMDQSTTSKVPGAYVAGLFGTARIVLYDTLLEKMTPAQVRFVMGHEMKHYLLGDAWKAIGAFLIVMLPGLVLIDRSGRAILRRWGGRIGARHLAEPAAIPLLLALLSLVSLVTNPILNQGSISIEHEADRFGLELTRDNEAAAGTFRLLQAEVLQPDDPDWFQRIFRLDHPALKDRIDFARTYHPWTEGRPLVYGARMAASPP